MLLGLVRCRPLLLRQPGGEGGVLCRLHVILAICVQSMCKMCCIVLGAYSVTVS